MADTSTELADEYTENKDRLGWWRANRPLIADVLEKDVPTSPADLAAFRDDHKSVLTRKLDTSDTDSDEGEGEDEDGGDTGEE